MSQGSQKNYLFVSNHCQHSKKLLQQLQSTLLINEFQIINIDDKRVQLPSFVQCVPTLYIPEKKEVIVGKDIFGYISKPTNSRTELPTKDEKGYISRMDP